MGAEYQLGSGEFTPQSPQFVQDVKKGIATESVTETVNIAAAANIKDAAGSTVVVDLTRGPILEKSGGKIGSFWGLLKNLQYSEVVQGVVETNGSAAFSVYDLNTDLEKIFEGVTEARYIAKLTDGAGNILYGWIGGVAVTSNVYTFSVFSGVALGSQNWFQGGSTAFDHAGKGSRVDIYKYSTSLTFGSSDTFTEEMPYHSPADPKKAGETEFRFLKSLSNGQYGIDYENQRFLGRKANADDTEAFTYKTYEQPASNVDVLSVIPGTGATNLGKAVDSVAGATDTGIAALFVRDDSLSTLTPIDGDYVHGRTNANGALWVDLAGLISGEDQTVGVMKVEQRFSFTNIATATTTTVKSGSGFFHALVINKAVAASTITMYNNTAGSGATIGTITFGAALLSDPPIPAFYNVTFSTGLTIVTSGAVDITVAYR